MILKRESGQKAAEGADAAEETLGETKAEGRAVGASLQDSPRPGGVPSHTHWTDVSSSQALMETMLSLPSEARSQTGELLPSTLPDPSLSGNTAAAF